MEQLWVWKCSVFDMYMGNIDEDNHEVRLLAARNSVFWGGEREWKNLLSIISYIAYFFSILSSVFSNS